MQFLDPNHPFFAPVWRRWATALFPLAWGGFELVMGNTPWAVMFLAVGAYAFWMLILKGPDAAP